MKELSTQLKVNNCAKYIRKLREYVGEDETNGIIEAIGGEERLMNAVMDGRDDSGLACKGSYIPSVLKMTSIAVSMNEMLPDEKKVPLHSLVKVCLLTLIARCIMYEENDSNWEKETKGIMFKFIDLEGALRTNERSLLICSNSGVKFSVTEYEAMKTIDKDTSSDAYTKIRGSVLSLLVRQAYDMMMIINRVI